MNIYVKKLFDNNGRVRIDIGFESTIAGRLRMETLGV